jgi:hypothetical protein
MRSFLDTNSEGLLSFPSNRIIRISIVCPLSVLDTTEYPNPPVNRREGHWHLVDVEGVALANLACPRQRNGLQGGPVELRTHLLS